MTKNRKPRLLVQLYMESHFPPALKRHYTAAAQRDGISFNGACVTALARHFGVSYTPPNNARTRLIADASVPTVVLKMPVPLKRRIDVRAAQQGRFKWQVVIDALTDEAAVAA